MIRKIRQKAKTGYEIIRILKNWRSYFASHFGLINGRYFTYKLRNGLTIKGDAFNKNCMGAINEIWVNRIYNPKGFEIKAGDIVVDVGGHIGIFSLLASRFAKNGQIITVEPFPSTFRILQENIRKNKIKNVLLVNKAISNKKGVKDLFLEGESTVGVTFFKDALENDNLKKESVKTITLEELMKECGIDHIDFLKMDCEGAEYEILFSCSPTILNKIGKISMEYHNLDESNNVSHLKKFLEGNGFNVVLGAGKYSTLYAKRRSI